MNIARKVPARYLVLLRDFLRAEQVDTDALLRMAGIDAAKFDRRDAMLEPAEMDAFIASGRRITGRTDLGFELGRLIKMTSHDLLGYGMLSCRNIDEVMRLVARHYHLMTETFTLRYRRTPGGPGEAVYTPAMAMPAETLHFYLEALAVAHDNQLRLMLPAGMRESWDIHISMPVPAHLSRYLSLSPTRFQFNEEALPGIRVVAGPAVLDHPLPLANVHVLREIDQRCEDMAARPRAAGTDWVQYLRMLFREAEGDAPTLEGIAQANRVSPRTIDRHLRRANLSFRGLAHEVRFERARDLLLNSTATVAQIAQRLGFSDAANFSRAFRREVGMPPAVYRERAGEEASDRA
jgi:AraC-like DNA-binding protein